MDNRRDRDPSLPDDTALGWTLLFVACELGDPRAADFLLRTASRRPARPRYPPAPFESYTGDLLKRLLAVKALHAIARQHPAVRDHILQILIAPPDLCVYLEAVAAAEDLGMGSPPERIVLA